jgi:N-acetylglucosaminyl-diphospho-decaprenol L-rhamnosyltransferase
MSRPAALPPRPRVRAFVVTWQGAHLLPTCLASLRAQVLPDVDWDVVVVDNASTDGTRELLAEQFPEVGVISSPTNVGFAGGMALGLADFDGDVAVLLNNDAELEPDAVAALVDGLRTDERAAATTARILLTGRFRPGGPDDADRWLPTDDADPDGRVLVNSTGNVVHRDGSGADRDWLTPLGEESTDPAVFGFCGGAAALRVAAVRAVGGFDARLFLYYEDTDLSWRLRAGGWTVRYVPDAVAHHRHAASSGADSPMFRHVNTRNSLVVTTRHAPAAVVATAWVRQLAGLVRAALRAPRSPLTRARLHGVRDALRLLPVTLRERRSGWRGAAVDRRAALQGHGPSR